MKHKGFISTLKNSLVALAVLVSVSPAAQASYSQVVFFGDSLTDTGNLYASTGNTFPVSPPYSNGAFSNGPLWSQTFAAALGSSAKSSLYGGGNYAWAGATVMDYGRPQPEIPQQLGQYFAKTGGSADASALYVIMGGGNDINDAGKTPGTAAANIASAAHAVDGMVNALYAAGARNILVGNLPDIGLTPLAAAGGPLVVGGATALTNLFNSTLQGLLSLTAATYSNLDLDLFDMHALLNSAVANPSAYGFSNVRDACKPGALGLPPGPGEGAVCADPDSYLFWDAFHPSARAQLLMAQTALAAIPEPSVLLLLAIALLAMLCFTPFRRRGMQVRAS